jgi:hypothetical protein
MNLGSAASDSSIWHAYQPTNMMCVTTPETASRDIEASVGIWMTVIWKKAISVVFVLMFVIG